MINFYNFAMLKEAQEIEAVKSSVLEAFGDRQLNSGLESEVNTLFNLVKKMYQSQGLDNDTKRFMDQQLKRVREVLEAQIGDLQSIFNDPKLSKKLIWIIKSLSEVEAYRNGDDLYALRQIVGQNRKFAVNDFRATQNAERQRTQPAPQGQFANKFGRTLPNFD